MHAVTETDDTSKVPVIENTFFQCGHGVGLAIGPDMPKIYLLMHRQRLELYTKLFGIYSCKAWDMWPRVFPLRLLNDKPENASTFAMKCENG